MQRQRDLCQLTFCVCVHVFDRWLLTYKWCVACIRSEQETPEPLWLDEHAGQDKASREAAPVTDSNEASPEPERCQSSIGLRNKISHEHTATKKVIQNIHKPLYINSDNVTNTLTIFVSHAHLWRVSVSAKQMMVCAYLPETCRGPHHSVCPPPSWTQTEEQALN